MARGPTLERLLSMATERPLALETAKAELVAAVLTRRASGDRSELEQRVAVVREREARRAASPSRRVTGDAARSGRLRDSGRGDMVPHYSIEEGGLAVLEVYGALTKRPVALDSSFVMASTIAIAEAAEEAMLDPDVRALVLAIESPGGAVDGTGELVARLRRMSAGVGKPIYAYVDGMAASAGYWVAAAAEFIAAPPEAITASIGVIAMFPDYSRQLGAQGVTVHVVRSAALKQEGNPYEPKSPEQLASLQRAIDSAYEVFRGDVAAARGLEPAAIDALEGRAMTAADALGAGLVDALASFDDALDLFRERLDASDTTTEPNPMPTTANPTTRKTLAKTPSARPATAKAPAATTAAEAMPEDEEKPEDEPGAETEEKPEDKPGDAPAGQKKGKAEDMPADEDEEKPAEEKAAASLPGAGEPAASLAQLKSALGDGAEREIVEALEQSLSLSAALAKQNRALKAHVESLRSKCGELEQRLGVAKQAGGEATPIAPSPAAAGADGLDDTDPKGSWARCQGLRQLYAPHGGKAEDKFLTWANARLARGQSWAALIREELAAQKG